MRPSCAERSSVATRWSGAGSVVTRDVPDYAIVVGNPTRQVGWICVCGNRLEGSGVCTRCGRNFAEKDGNLSEAGTAPD